MFEVTKSVKDKYPKYFRRFGKRWMLDDLDCQGGYTNDRKEAMRAVDRINRHGKLGQAPGNKKWSAIIVKFNLMEYPNNPLYGVFVRGRR